LPTKTIASIVLCAALSCATGVAADETDDLTAQGGQLIQQLAGALQTELVAAMQSGGPVAAVDVCNHQAFDITYNVSDAAEGWEISRSSHRLRNPANTPDEYTAAAMDVLLSRAADGETPQTLVTAEIVEDGDQRVFRMVKAIPTGEVCLTCHGSTEVSAEVEAVIAEYYPEDAARGFALGDMRGVFTLNKVLE